MDLVLSVEVLSLCSTLSVRALCDLGIRVQHVEMQQTRVSIHFFFFLHLNYCLERCISVKTREILKGELLFLSSAIKVSL